MSAPKGDGLQARRDRAILALMGVHGLRVAEVAGLLGHASVTTTQVYAKVVDRMTENPARYLAVVTGCTGRILSTVRFPGNHPKGFLLLTG